MPKLMCEILIGGFELLQKAVATGAFHNSGERFDPPRCHPNTRTAVIDKIMNWILGLAEEECEAVIMWLHGAAGAGKSAIAQTIAERCHALNLLLASFFFSRSDPSRSHGKYFIATIAYQVATNLPSTRALITAAMEKDPLLVERSLETQVLTLLVGPLQNLVTDGYFNFTSCQRLIIIIDGLDECNNPSAQRGILDAISHLFRAHHIPILFFVSSRPESHLSQFFNSKPLVDLLVRLPLDVDYGSADDIHLFLSDKFKEIKETHPLKTFIDPTWPSRPILKTLVEKSSGQFIFAATVVRYVSSVRHNPPDRLGVILGQSPQQGGDMPFAEIDSLYTYIFSGVENIKEVLHIVALILVSPVGMTPENAASFLCLKPGQLEMLLGDLSSVISVTPSQLMHMFHASLSDFLLDPLRSKMFHLDMPVINSYFSHLCFGHIKAGEFPSTVLDGVGAELNAGLHLGGDSTADFSFSYSTTTFLGYCASAAPSRQLYDDILSLPLTDLICWYRRQDDDDEFFQLLPRFLSYLKTLVCHLQLAQLYKSIVYHFNSRLQTQKHYSIIMSI
jgi:hypothetical protein